MGSTGEHLAAVVREIRESGRRYPGVVIIEREGQVLSAEVQEEIASLCGLRCVDVTEELKTAGGEDPGRGLVGRGRFLEWVLETARQSEGLLLLRTDWVMDTWPERERFAFLREFIRTECNNPGDETVRIPILLPTSSMESHRLPRERIGQGYVVDFGAFEL